MKLKTPKQIAAEIERTNKKFKKATPAQKRVMIAQDVIHRLKQKQFKASTGDWVRGDIDDQSCEDNPSVQKLLLSGVKCDVCALGATFMSCTALNNNQTMDQYLRECNLGSRIVNRANFSNGFTDIFDRHQLALIETAFEEGCGYDRWGSYIDSDDKAPVEFGSRYRDDNKRLMAIMKNIVKNKGTFKP